MRLPFPRFTARSALSLAAASALSLTALSGFAPMAQAGDKVALDYRFYLGGVLIGKASIAAALDEASYRLDTKVRSDGVVGWFYDVTVEGLAEGARESGAKLTPSVFRFNSVAEGEPFNLDMRFEDDAPKTVKAEPPFQPRHYEIDPTQQRGALDPMTAIVAALFPDAAKPLCKQTFPIFDGRRRYDITLEGQISEKREDDTTIIECRGRWKRVGGFKPKHMRKPDYLFTVRYARDPSGRTLPVRAWTETEFGAAIATLSTRNGRRVR